MLPEFDISKIVGQENNLKYQIYLFKSLKLSVEGGGDYVNIFASKRKSVNL